MFRALKVPLSWSMLSDVLSRLVESVGDGSEDVQVCGFECFALTLVVPYERRKSLLPPALILVFMV